MKSHLTTLFIALIVGYLGGISSQFFQPESTPVNQAQDKNDTGPSGLSPMQAESSDLTLQVKRMQEKIGWLETQLNEVAKNQTAIEDSMENRIKIPAGKSNRQGLPIVPGKGDLVSAGVAPEVADDILRRISQQQFRSMELRNLMRRNAASGTRQYGAELRELNKNKITLRSELDDNEYDKYLLVSGQNNRVKVSSVMAGSPAESNGIYKGDVILYYGDQKILNIPDLRKATLEGDIDSFANIEILRDGMRMSLVVQRGTLGVQLEAIRLDPVQ